MNRRITVALAALAGLAATASVASATEVQWPTGGGDTAWSTLETRPAVLPDGGLAVVRRLAASSTDNLVRLTSSGFIASTGPALTFASANNASGGVAADAAGNVYMISDNDPIYSKIVKFTPDGTESTVWQQTATDRYIEDPILIDARGRLVFMAVDSSGPDQVQKLIRVNTDGSGAQEFQPGAPNSSAQIGVDQRGNAYMALWGSGGLPARVMKISDDGVMTELASLGNVITRVLASSSNGTLNILLDDGTVTTISPQGVVGALPGVTLPCSAVNHAGVIDANGALYYVRSCGGTTSQVYRVPADGAPGLIGSFAGEIAWGLSLDGAGNISVGLRSNSAFTARIVRISSGGGTPDIAPAPPAVPQAPTATAGERSATVTVPSPTANAQFGTPTSYEVAAAADSAKSCTITLPATSCTVTGLTGGTRYTFVAKARLLSWLTPASAASGAVVPTSAPEPTPNPAPAPSRLGATTKCSGARCSTTGRLPAGATKVIQSATTGTRANAMSQLFARRNVKGTCTLSPAKVKGKKVRNRTYTCRITLAKGTWTVTTDAFAGARKVATSSRKVTVRR